MRLPTIVLCALLTACATNPVTGRRELSLVSESQEVQMGRDAAQGDLKRVGEIDNAGLRQLITRLGTTIASKSERPSLPWEFHVLDEAVVNAFAYPGGFIFVTRGLLTHVNSEAELAEVVGHEIGHVTAKHSVAQISQQQVAQIGLVAGSILSPQVAKYGDLLGQGASLLFLKFGRDDERQADALGFRYSLANGYDVREAPKIFSTLARLAGESSQRIPEWQSTHPDPGNRVQTAQQRVAEVPATTLASARVNRESYLRLLDGVVFGENPRQGYFAGRTFLHPDLRFQLDLPNGWNRMNMPEAVVAQSTDGNAQFQLAQSQGSTAQAVQSFVGQQGIQVGQSGNTTINGLPATFAEFQAQTESGTIRGLAAGVSYGGATYLMVGLMSSQVASQRYAEVEATIRSFRPLTDPAALNVQPARLKIITLPSAMTASAFVQRYPSTVAAEQIYIINGVEASTQLVQGMLVKQVVGGIPAR